MKAIYLFTLLLLGVGCAHKEVKKVDEQIKRYEYKAHSTIEKEIQEMLEHHPEFTKDQKLKINDLLLTSLKKNRELKVKESQMTQHLLELSIAKRSSYSEISSLRIAMKKNYEAKAKLFESTAIKLKKIIGITIPQNDFESEMGQLFLKQVMK